MRVTDIPKRQRNAIIARIESAVKKYGFDEVRLVWNNYNETVREQERISKEIEEKAKELAELKRRSRT